MCQLSTRFVMKGMLSDDFRRFCCLIPLAYFQMKSVGFPRYALIYDVLGIMGKWS